MYCNKFIVPQNLWPHTNTSTHGRIAHIYIIPIFLLAAVPEINVQTSAICRWVCFMDLKHFEHRLQLTVWLSKFGIIIYTYVYSNWYRRIGVLSIHTIKTKHLYVQCTYMCSKPPQINGFRHAFCRRRCCLDIYDSINMNTNDCRRNDKKNESKWNEMKKEVRTTKLTPTFMSTLDVHFDRTVPFWPRQTIFNCDKLQLVHHLPDVCLCACSVWSHKPSINTSHFDLLLRWLVANEIHMNLFYSFANCNLLSICPTSKSGCVCVCVGITSKYSIIIRQEVLDKLAQFVNKIEYNLWWLLRIFGSTASSTCEAFNCKIHFIPPSDSFHNDKFNLKKPNLMVFIDRRQLGREMCAKHSLGISVYNAVGYKMLRFLQNLVWLLFT